MPVHASGSDLTADVVVVGGGLVGCAVAFGLVQRGARVVVLDGQDHAFRASRGNFGMVWVQGKGLDFPAYAHLTRQASDRWADFSALLKDETGIDAAFSRPGGFDFCFTGEELEKKRASLTRLSAQTGGAFRFEILDREGVRHLLPGVGDIAGAAWCRHDGGAHPLNLLHALQTALEARGAVLLSGKTVHRIEAQPAGYLVEAEGVRISAGRVLLAAGLANSGLAGMVGLDVPIRPVRGQILVTGRLPPFMPYVSGILRQMPEGTCLIGGTNEEAGYDEGVLTSSVAAISARALRVFPSLAAASIVRTWGALRIMTPDGLPVYTRSQTFPGVWLVTVHSGVTLAPVHADYLSRAILEDAMPPDLMPFSESRFVSSGSREAHHVHAAR